MKRRAIYREGYFKVSRRIFDSSLYMESGDVVKVFFALLGMAQDPAGPQNGVVHVARRQLAAKCFMSDAQLCAALETLCSEDAESRTTASGGRRLEVLPNGFRILNFDLYHDGAKDQEISLLRSRAGRIGGVNSAEARRINKLTSSKTEANVKQKPDTEKRRDGEETETETDTSNGLPGSADERPVALAQIVPPPPKEPDLPAVFVRVFNAAFDRRLGLTPEIRKRVEARKRDGYRPWQLIALPVLVASRPMESAMAKRLTPEMLLRDGKHPRQTRDGYTAGATDWLERELNQLDRAVLDARLASLADQVGILGQLKAVGVSVREESGL